ncbi:MAG: cytochrome d ubiquinol oxidase subunit II [Burkholderiaceae bacterium]
MATSPQDMLVVAWFGMLCVMLVFYVITDGFDLGTGIISLTLRREEERSLLFRSIAHVWDANETWLVVLGGALFGAFPAAYALILSGLYVPISAMIFGFILRGASIEFRHAAHWKPGWDLLFGLGSLLVALAQGWVLGRIITGMSADAMSLAFTAATSIGVACGYTLLGATYLVRKTGGPLASRARKLALVAVIATVAAAIVASAGTLLVSPLGRDRWDHPGVFHALLALGAIAALSFVFVLLTLVKGSTTKPFLGSVVMFLASLGGLAVSIYPNVVPGRLTLAEAASGESTLIFMLFGVGILMPVMLGYNIYQYMAFRGVIQPAKAP